MAVTSSKKTLLWHLEQSCTVITTSSFHLDVLVGEVPITEIWNTRFGNKSRHRQRRASSVGSAWASRASRGKIDTSGKDGKIGGSERLFP